MILTVGMTYSIPMVLTEGSVVVKGYLSLAPLGNINKSNFSFPNLSGGQEQSQCRARTGALFSEDVRKTAPVRVFLPAFEADKELRLRT